MIGKLKGIVDTIGEGEVMLDVGGVGYVAFCSASTLRQLPPSGDAATLYIETHVREDHIHLFGFGDMAEKEAFLLLTSVSGVGAKVALAILSALTPQALSNAIAAQDVAAFKPVSGVGPKLANRIISELKDKFSLPISAMQSFAVEAKEGAASAAAAPAHASGDNVTDAIAALTSLGYSRSDAYQAIQRVMAEGGSMELDHLVRQGLKQLSTV